MYLSKAPPSSYLKKRRFVFIQNAPLLLQKKWLLPTRYEFSWCCPLLFFIFYFASLLIVGSLNPLQLDKINFLNSRIITDENRPIWRTTALRYTPFRLLSDLPFAWEWRAPILVYESSHWYQCAALCELVWMHCVIFFRGDLLKRYRQTTAENRHLNTHCIKTYCFTIE